MEGKDYLLNLEERFYKNLKLLGRIYPQLLEKFEKYTPNADLILDPKEGWNIYDRKKDSFLYPKDGRLVTYQQLAQWLQKPNFFTLLPTYVKGNPDWLHIRYINKLIDLRKEILKDSGLSIGGESLPLLIVAGIGLGQHLEFLTSNFEIENLLILEPNEDFFYISLHLLDWEKILKPFDGNPFKNFLLLVGEDALEVDKSLDFFERIGPFKVSTSFLYLHYLTEEFDNFLKKLVTDVGRTVSFFGFFDDEIISLKHTLTNIKNKVPLFDPINKDFQTPETAVVVGSGPSLEELLPYLKRYRNKLFVISCGTALSILEKNGIVPDLHVNIERNEPPYRVAKKTTSEEFRKKITFLGANNNFPKIFEIFGKSAYYLKGADAGAYLFKDKEPLPFVNPTVTNTGLALAFYLGFKKVFLFGVDLAFPEKKHHAKGSYYETVSNAEKIYKGDIEVEGNFGGKIPTNRIFYSSIRVMEHAIKHFKQQKEHFEVFNPNRGAKIKGAKPITVDELETLLKTLPEENIEEFKQRFWNLGTEIPRIEDFNFPQIKMQLMTNFFQLKQVMEADLENLNKTDNYKEVIEDFYNYLLVIINHNRLIFSLLHGTLTQFLAHTYLGIFADVPLDVKQNYLRQAFKLLKELLTEMEKEIYNLYKFFPL